MMDSVCNAYSLYILISWVAVLDVENKYSRGRAPKGTQGAGNVSPLYSCDNNWVALGLSKGLLNFVMKFYKWNFKHLSTSRVTGQFELSLKSVNK